MYFCFNRIIQLAHMKTNLDSKSSDTLSFLASAYLYLRKKHQHNHGIFFISLL